MNALTRDLKKLTAEAEKRAEEDIRSGKSRFRQRLHLMPPVGWLNDPNGLCQFKGIYHAFFQYAPFNVEGGVKMWGHYTSGNLIDWEYQGVSMYPDQPFDCSGVYSGCAFIEDGEMYLYYTGSVKLEDRDDYDYVNTGREANTVLVTSKDGFHFGRKRLLMKNSDYPADLTLHVRDPKVWKKDGTYYMVQGARTKENVGQAVVFCSEDKINWKVHSRVKTPFPFGYMWECPDYFETDGVKIFSASVQGLEGGVWEDRNVYQSGYFMVHGDITGDYSLSEYRLWDYGFDYYAPQSFQTEDGRTVLIAWMGMPDCEEYTNRTIAEGWQHCFTFPREIFVETEENVENGGEAGKTCGKTIVRQRPVRELEQMMKYGGEVQGRLETDRYRVYDLQVTGIRENRFHAQLAGGLQLDWHDGRFEMYFENRDKNSPSAGRSVRYAEADRLEDVRILADISSVEVFVNDGEYVFSTRYYPEDSCICVEADGAQIRLGELI